METHFEGSRGEENPSHSHQRQYDEQNPDIVNQTDNEDSDLSEVDSPVNTDFSKNAETGESLTNDESADTNPNDVDDKPDFNRNENL